MKRIHPEDPRVTSHALGELPKHEAGEIDLAAMANPAMQVALAETRQLADLIREGFQGESHELGEARREAIRRAGRQPLPENLVSLEAKRRWGRPAAVTAAAAALVIGVVWVLQQIPAGDDGRIAQAEQVRLEELRMQILMTPAPRPERLVGRPHLPMAPLRAGSTRSEVGAELPAKKVDEEYLAMRQLLEEDPEAFFNRVKEVARTAGVRALSKLPTLIDNPFIPSIEEARSSIPLISGQASYPLVERFVRTDGKLPPSNGVRIEELINQVTYIDDGDADLDGIRLGAEMVRCPWDEGAILMGVLLYNGSESKISNDAILQVEVKPEHIRSYRLIGYAGVPGPEANPAALSQGLAPGQSNYVLYQLQPSNREVFEAHRVVARVALQLGEESVGGLIAPVTLRGLIVPVTSPPRDWNNASNNLQTAVSVGAWGMLLRDCAYKGALSTGVLRTLASDAMDGAEDGDLVRRGVLQLVRDSLELLSPRILE